ncbi:related to pre-tRNA processing protein / PF I subunit [Phialocephala subalpina]|uniref:Related to pre-tRNA processing protein / PF I subunit n=1 Tax=Phialocephala subalpina TaxID=576137 RepID=A0A1L7WMW3_9HELO|nr:related to pre-tRNA processing protein / PF I subunit [Phialocephala subalpina]
MAAPALSVEQQIKQLDDARKLVLSDANYYPQIIQGILPIAAPGARVELRRWVSDFLAETFASPSIPAQQKETMSLIVLDTLKSMIENPQEDAAVVKSVVQTAASVYPLVVRWIINNSYDGPTWEKMLAIKSRILRIWDTAATGVRICCIKFAQRVVLVQTKGPDADPRRGDPLEVSLSMVPPNHPLIPPNNLQAEASGLLDRMLAVFQENISDAILVDATLNSLSILIRARPHIANRILNVILNFNPLKQANSPMTPKSRVMIKSMEKTTRSLLVHILKRDNQHPLAGKIQQYVERMMRSKSDIFDEQTRKRGPPEPTDGLDAAKRQKLSAQVKPAAPKFHVPPLAPGSHSVAELFTVTTEEGLKGFDVAQLAEHLVVQIGITILQRLDADTLNQAVEGVRKRLQSMSAAQPEMLNAATAPLDVEEDDDYEPDFYGAEDTEQILNKLDGAPPLEETKLQAPAPDMALGHFTLPAPPPLTHEQVAQVGQGTVARVFEVMQTLEEKGKTSKAGINRLAASAYDRPAWITIITRLATRASAGLEEVNAVKLEPHQMPPFSLGNNIRESLYRYIFEDFRKRIDIAVQWLCEEWYNDKMQMKSGEDAVLHYEKWAIKVIDGIVPYLDGQDRALVIKFLGEIPGLSMEVLERVKGLCVNPTTVNMALQSLLFLVAYRPPARELVLAAVEDVWNTYEDARPVVVKLFTKYRPDYAERIKAVEEEKKSNGVAEVPQAVAA